MLKNPHPGDHLLLLALDLQLSNRRHARVAAHVAGCTECQARVEHLRSTMLESDRLYRLVDPSSASTLADRERLERALRQAGETWDRSWRARVRYRGIATTTINRALTTSAV